MAVLIMNGKFDNAPVRSREMSKKIAGAEHHIIPGAGLRRVRSSSSASPAYLNSRKPADPYL